MRLYTYILSPAYHTSLQHLIKALANVNPLKKLEILTDSTKFSVDTAKMMVKLHNLEELVLHNIGHFHNSASESYRVDVEIANLIIKNSLLNKRISVLRLVKFEQHENTDKLVIHSDNLKQLHVLQCKDFEKMDLVLPSLIHFETESIYLDYLDLDIYKLMKKMLDANCPMLQTWNGVNVKELAEKVGKNSWAEHITFPPYFSSP